MSENVTDFEQKINNINVCLKTGNVAAEDADCIVVPEFRDGASGSGVGYAIETAGMGAGLEAYEKVAQEGFLKDGDAIITESGKPDVKLAHVVTVSAREDSQFEVVNRSVLKTLETANEVGIKRIALPEIGTGIIDSLTQEQSAKAIFNAVYEFSKNNPSSSVEEVSFVVYRSSTEPAKRVLTDKSYIDFVAKEQGEKQFDIGEWAEGMGNHGTKKSKESPTEEEILQDKATYEYGRNLITKLFWAETPEAVDAYIKAGIEVNQKNLIERKTALDFCIERIVKDINHFEDSDNRGAALALIRHGGDCSVESLEKLKAKDPQFHARVINMMEARDEIEAIRENPQLKINELRVRLGVGPKDVNQPKNLTLAGSKTHEPLHSFDTVTHETRHAENAKITHGNEASQKHKNLRRKDLLNRAEYISDEGYLGIDNLCKKMVKAAKVGPVKSADEGYMFVVDKGATLEETLFAWKEQVRKPWLEERLKNGKITPETLVKIVQKKANSTNIDNTAVSFIEAATVELLVTKYPEHADKLTLLQLINAYNKAGIGSETQNKIDDLLEKNIREYMSGKETFPPSLENVVTFNNENDILLFSSTMDISTHDLEKRVAATELKMLQSLQPEDLELVSDKVLSEGNKIAKKHKESGDYGKLFLNEVKSRLAQGNTVNPYDNG